jgi:hypothetical protein
MRGTSEWLGSGEPPGFWGATKGMSNLCQTDVQCMSNGLWEPPGAPGEPLGRPPPWSYERRVKKRLGGEPPGFWGATKCMSNLCQVYVKGPLGASGSPRGASGAGSPPSPGAAGGPAGSLGEPRGASGSLWAPPGAPGEPLGRIFAGSLRERLGASGSNFGPPGAAGGPAGRLREPRGASESLWEPPGAPREPLGASRPPPCEV